MSDRPLAPPRKGLPMYEPDRVRAKALRQPFAAEDTRVYPSPDDPPASNPRLERFLTRIFGPPGPGDRS